jgi:hypothetical protein
MSLIGTIAKGAIGAGIGEFFGNGGQNIANQLSKQVGCQILQSDAAGARAQIARGVNPCTGLPTNGARVPGILDPRFGLPPGAIPGSSPIPVFDAPLVTGPGGAQVPPSVLAGGSALEFTATGLIRNVIVNGRRISRRNAAAFIRKAGMEVGARGLGLTLQQAAQVVLQQSTRPRRRRGISGAQITQAKRVISTIASMSKSLGCTTRRAPARRKPTCR